MVSRTKDNPTVTQLNKRKHGFPNVNRFAHLMPSVGNPRQTNSFWPIQSLIILRSSTIHLDQFIWNQQWVCKDDDTSNARHSYWLRVGRRETKTKWVKWKWNEGEDKKLKVAFRAFHSPLLSPVAHRKGFSLWSFMADLKVRDCKGKGKSNWVGRIENSPKKLFFWLTELGSSNLHLSFIDCQLPVFAHLSPDRGSLLCFFCILIHECWGENASITNILSNFAKKYLETGNTPQSYHNIWTKL